MSDIMRDFVEDKFTPGKMNIIYGPKGDGKTFAALSMAQNIMDGLYGHENVAMITNILMGRVTSGLPVKGTPPGVFYSSTIAGTMKKVGEILAEFGRDCMILWVLDEAQNFMMADQNALKENQAMKMFLANTRKLGICNFFLTPALGNLGPRIRNYASNTKSSGYCDFQWMKSRTRAEKIAPRGKDYRDIIFVRGDGRGVDLTDFRPIVISPGTWGRNLYKDKSLKPGDYAYDTLSTADLKMGQNAKGEEFDFYKFLEATSDDLSHNVPELIADFFAKWEGEDGGDGNEQIYISLDYQMTIVDGMRRNKITWSVIADIFGKPVSTITNQYYVWLKKRGASKFPKSQQGSCAPVYINPIGGKEEGFFDPSGNEDDKGGCRCSS